MPINTNKALIESSGYESTPIFEAVLESKSHPAANPNDSMIVKNPKTFKIVDALLLFILCEINKSKYNINRRPQLVSKVRNCPCFPTTSSTIVLPPSTFSLILPLTQQ